MDNLDKKKIGYVSGGLLLFFSMRSFLVINDLLTGVIMLILGTAILYANETD